MEELIINCETGERTRRKFTAVEVEHRLAEIAEAVQDEAEQTRTALKDELIGMQSRAKEVKQLVKEGIFEQGDLDAAEARIAELKAQVKEL